MCIYIGNGEKINYWLEAYGNKFSNVLYIVTFYSKYNRDLTFENLVLDTCNLSLENLNNIDGGETFVPGHWYFVAVVVGSPVGSGRYHILKRPLIK